MTVILMGIILLVIKQLSFILLFVNMLVVILLNAIYLKIVAPLFCTCPFNYINLQFLLRGFFNTERDSIYNYFSLQSPFAVANPIKLFCIHLNDLFKQDRLST